MNAIRRHLRIWMLTAGVVIAFLAGVLSADLQAKASTQAVTPQQLAAIQASYLLLDYQPVRVFLPVARK